MVDLLKNVMHFEVLFAHVTAAIFEFASLLSLFETDFDVNWRDTNANLKTCPYVHVHKRGTHLRFIAIRVLKKNILTFFYMRT